MEGYLAGLVGHLMKSGEDLAFHMLYLVTKIFYHANLMSLCPCLRQKETLAVWLNFFVEILEQKVPPELSSPVEDEQEVESRRKNFVWKLKDVVSAISYQLILKYGNTDVVALNDKALARHIQHTFAPTLAQANLRTLFMRKELFVPDKVLANSVNFLITSLKIKEVEQELKPLFKNILFETIVPILIANETYLALFE